MKEKAQSAEGLLDVAALGEILGMSTNSIYRRRSLGESLPQAIRIGRALRWRRSDVDRWVEEQMETV